MSQIIKLFATSTLVNVLSLFLQNADEEFYQSDIVHKTGKALMQVQRALKTLQEVGLITSCQRGRQIYYRISKNHPAFSDLKALFFKTVILGDTIRLALEPMVHRIRSAFVYGSIAQGSESADSDIDLFILGDISLRELSKVLGPLSKKLSRELNPVLCRASEFKKRIVNKDHFLLEVSKKSKIWIIGNQNELEKLVEGRKVKSTSHLKR